MKESTINEILETHLREKGFFEEEIKKIVKNLNTSQKKIKKARKIKDKERLEKEIEELDDKIEEEMLETRHGTTCVGILSKKKGKKPKAIIEF